MFGENGTDLYALQDSLAGLVRAFGQHHPEQMPCGEPIPDVGPHALAELAQDAQLSQVELGRRLMLEKSTVSRLVGQLAARGWIQRGRDDRDGRVVLLSLTAAGRQAGRGATGEVSPGCWQPHRGGASKKAAAACAWCQRLSSGLSSTVPQYDGFLLVMIGFLSAVAEPSPRCSCSRSWSWCLPR